MNDFVTALHWQSRAVLGRHVRVHLRKWFTGLLPPVLDPVIMLLAFGVGLGSQMKSLPWGGGQVPYLAYLAPGILAYAAFTTAFFQSLFSAYVRMHFQKSWEGQLTSQVRLEHVVWGEALWASTMGTAYAIVVCGVLAVFGALGTVQLHWAWMPVALPVIFLAALGFSAVGLLFTALLPSMDHMSLPFYLLIVPLGFASSTYFPLPDVPWLQAAVQVNPLHHLAEGVRWLLLEGRITGHLAASAGLSTLLLALLIPLDMRLLRRRVFGDA
ncbi:MAG: ABC transporter permease [Myxococcales bacterium]|nr:ABC transporter permease [Myxococcales bacterium]